jgi:hypothetical protein
MSVGFFGDTGWYQMQDAKIVQYADEFGYAQTLTWGWQAGCSFVTRVSATLATAFPNYFCPEEVVADKPTSCAWDGRALASCGTMQLMEWEGVTTPVLEVGNTSSKSCVLERPVSAAESQLGTSWYGTQTRCFQSTIMLAGASARELAEPSCFQRKCSSNGDGTYTLMLEVGGEWKVCPFVDGSEEHISFSGYSGKIVCPGEHTRIDSARYTDYCLSYTDYCLSLSALGS